ncbi:MAG: GIY-YIG nuclease family protein [Verrucomicrobiia bacterium]|jgi:predicted GIY-YIG superfamily endonuclease
MTEQKQEQFFYVYILESVKAPSHFYTGFTEDIKQRLIDHNEGKSVHTAELRPWRIKTCIAFADREKALNFEHYLKTASGRAFAKKRL